MYVWLYVYAHYRSLVFIDTWFFSSVLLCNPAGKLQAGRALLPSPVTWATKKRNGEEILRKLGYGEKIDFLYIHSKHIQTPWHIYTRILIGIWRKWDISGFTFWCIESYLATCWKWKKRHLKLLIRFGNLVWRIIWTSKGLGISSQMTGGYQGYARKSLCTSPARRGRERNLAMLAPMEPRYQLWKAEFPAVVRWRLRQSELWLCNWMLDVGQKLGKVGVVLWILMNVDEDWWWMIVDGVWPMLMNWKKYTKCSSWIWDRAQMTTCPLCRFHLLRTVSPSAAVVSHVFWRWTERGLRKTGRMVGWEMCCHKCRWRRMDVAKPYWWNQYLFGGGINGWWWLGIWRGSSFRKHQQSGFPRSSRMFWWDVHLWTLLLSVFCWA